MDIAFVVNGKTASGGSQDGYRDASEVTLTDVLPQYTDKDGATRTAVFDAEENPGRTLADDGMTVSKTYTGVNSEDVLVQIYNDALHLRFPGLRFATDSDGNASVNLTNTVRLSAVPSNASEGETRPSAEDDIRFRVTDDPVGRGSFGKVAYKGDIYDVGIYKTNPYPWKIDLSNAHPQPLQHIVIQDRKIEENGKTVLEGLDEALKFVRLESYLSLPEGTTAADIVDLVGDNLDEYQGKEGKTADLYDLNNNGRSDDQIAFAYSDATIVAAQSIYAEKFVAPAGSDHWSNQGRVLNIGSDFDYLLKITNETTEVHTGVAIYDVLPAIGDSNISGATARGSEFPVRLREAITPPEGYKVYYTTSPEVYHRSMSEMLAADVWTDAPADYSEVTAFRLAAGEGVTLAGRSSVQVRVPVCAARTLDADAMAILAEKTYRNGSSGALEHLVAVNFFDFQTDQLSSAKESNAVRMQIPFVGFWMKKVDARNGNIVPGAEFTLTNKAGTVTRTGVTDEQGRLLFRELPVGSYTLTETKTPDGYFDRRVSLTLTIAQNPITLEYTVTFGGGHTEAGTSADPLIVENDSSYELPQTGGMGTGLKSYSRCFARRLHVRRGILRPGAQGRAVLLRHNGSDAARDRCGSVWSWAFSGTVCSETAMQSGSFVYIAQIAAQNVVQLGILQTAWKCAIILAYSWYTNRIQENAAFHLDFCEGTRRMERKARQEVFLMDGKMKAIVATAPNEYGIQMVDIPKPGYGEVLCRVRSVSICGSDPGLFEGHYDYLGWPPHYPFIFGHEWAGEVVELGEGVGTLKVGDRVAGEAHSGCGVCANCKQGFYTLCLNYGKNEKGNRHYGFTTNGAYAEYGVFTAKSCEIMPDEVSFDEATMCDTAGVALQSLRNAALTANEYVAIYGPGPIGNLAMQIANARGAKTIMVGRGARLAMAKRDGALHCIDYTKQDPVTEIMKLTDGLGADAAIEAAGTPDALHNAISCLRKNGRVSCIALHKNPEASVPINDIVCKQIHVNGSRANPYCSKEVLQMLKEKKIDTKDLITHTFDMEQIHEAVELFENRRDGVMKVVIHV